MGDYLTCRLSSKTGTKQSCYLIETNLNEVNRWLRKSNIQRPRKKWVIKDSNGLNDADEFELTFVTTFDDQFGEIRSQRMRLALFSLF